MSGLKSRAHLIRKYSFPSCKEQSSLHALSRLYVQKGFALSDIHSALWPTNTSGDRPLCVGSTPVSKGFAIFSAFLFFNFSVLRQGVDPRVQRTHLFTALGVVWHQIRGAGIGSQISPTLSNLAVTLIERSRSSTYQEVLTQPNFFIILQSGTSTAVLSLYRSTIFMLQCSKCLHTWTFMVVHSNWSWLPTILLMCI